MTNEELVNEYQHGNEKALEELCKANTGLVRSIVKDYRAVYSGECGSREAVTSSDDVAQYGYIGLIQAAKDYEPDRGAAFSTVASIYIRTVVRRAMYGTAGVIRLPESRLRQISRLRKCRSFFLVTHGRKPTNAEISAFCGVGVQEVESLILDEIRANTISLETPAGEDGGTLGDILPGSDATIEDAEDRMYNEHLRTVLWGEVDKLGREPAEILRKYYEDGETLRQICEELGLSYGRGHSIKTKALKALQEGKCGRALRHFVKEYERADSMAYNGSSGSFLRTHTSATERAAFVRLRAEEKALREVKTLAELEAAGIGRADRRELYRMQRQRQQEEQSLFLQKLREEL